MTIPTPHIETINPSLIAQTVIMPGDPLRAKFIAETFLTDIYQFNATRNMLGYTGTYKGKTISVMGSGMGNPSIGIYAHELFSFYNVDQIIRVGSSGAYDKDLKIYDLILVKDTWSESSFAKVYCGSNNDVFSPNKELNTQIMSTAIKHDIKLQELRAHTTEVFYRQRFEDYIDIRDNHNCSVVDMESFALFAIAETLNKKAACVLTISDSLVSHETTTSGERETAFTTMIKLVLESV